MPPPLAPPNHTEGGSKDAASPTRSTPPSSSSTRRLSLSSSSSSASSEWSAVFGTPDFDMKRWINQQIEKGRSDKKEGEAGMKGKGTGDSSSPSTPTHGSSSSSSGASASSSSDLAATASHLSSLLMKMQLTQADINQSMDRQSQELVQAMPKALREISFIHRESQSLRTTLTDILKDMASMDTNSQQTAAVVPVQGTNTTGATPSSPPVSGTATVPAPAPSAASTIEFLQSIDVVKGRILRCAHTLEEMEQWKKREANMDKLLEGILVAGGGSTTMMLTSADAAATLSFLPPSCFHDLHLLHTELLTMQSIVDRLKSMGLSKEHAQRQQRVDMYRARMVKVAEVAMEQAMEQAQVETGAEAANDATSSSPVLTHLHILHQLYQGLGQLDAFHSKYETGKIKAAWSHQILTKYKVAQKKKAKEDATATAGQGGEKYAVQNLGSWLGEFYSDVIRYAANEIQFAQQVFSSSEAVPAATASDSADETSTAQPAASPSSDSSSSSSLSFIHSSLLSFLHTELVPLLQSWLHTFLSTRNSADAVDHLITLWNLTLKQLGWPLANIFFPPPAEDTDEERTEGSEAKQREQQNRLIDILYQPFVKYLEDYAAWEKKKLLSTLDGLSFTGDNYDHLTHTLSTLQSSLLTASSAARQRCVDLSQGVLVESLLSATQDFYGECAVRLQGMVKHMRQIAGVEETKANNKRNNASQPFQEGGQGSADEDVFTDDSSTSASAAAALAAADSLADADRHWSHFQGCFRVLRSARAIQAAVLDPQHEQAWLGAVCGEQLVSIVRACEEGKGGGAKQAAAITQAAANNTRRMSTSAPIASAVTSAPTPSSFSSSPFSSPADLSRTILVTFLLRHPDRLKSLSSFLHTHFLPTHPHLLHPSFSGTGAEVTCQTQGLVSSHPPTTPSATLLSVASPSAAGIQARAKYGFPTTPAAGTSSPNSQAAASASSSPRLFSSAAHPFDLLISSLHTLIFATLFLPLRSKLSSFHTWSSIWVARSSSSSSTSTSMLSSIPLPSFSMQPSDYMIQVGEHILNIGQQLEPFVGGKQEGDEEKEEDEQEAAMRLELSDAAAAAPASPFHKPPPSSVSSPTSPSAPTYLEHDALYWLNLLSTGTFDALLSGVRRLPLLSEKGAKQLHTDLEYLINVLSALGINMPLSVLKVTLWLQWNEAQTQAKLAEGSAGEWRIDELTTEDKRMLRHLIHCRRFRNVEADKQLVTQLES